MQKPLPRLVFPALKGVSAVSASQSTMLTLLRTFELMWLTRLDLRGFRSVLVAVNPVLTLDKSVAISPKSLFNQVRNLLTGPAQGPILLPGETGERKKYE